MIEIILLLTGLTVALVLLLKKPKIIYVAFKTLRRDSTGIVRFVKTSFTLWYTRQFNLTVDKLFDATAKKYPNKVCFYFEDQEWTFRKVWEMTNKVANYFAGQGLTKGDAVALFMENRVEYVCIWLGLAKLGVIPALVNTNLRLKSLEHSLSAAKCKALIYGQELSEAVAELRGSIDGLSLYSYSTEEGQLLPKAIDLHSELKDSSAENPILKYTINFYDNLFYIYTSGTTGLPKAAVIKHGRYIMASAGSHYMQDIRTTDVVYCALPFYHSAAAMLGVGHAINFGSSMVFRKKFSASNYWKDCIKYRVTVAQYIGELCRYLLVQPSREEDTMHSVRLIFGNGLRADIWTEFAKRFNIPNISEFYGATEGNCNLVNIDNKVGAVGFIPRLFSFLLSIVLIKVDKNTGEPIRDPKTGLAIQCGPNEPGELLGVIKKGDPIKDFLGYTDSEASRGKKVVRDIFTKGDEAFRSGDILVMDDYGYFYFKDRTGDTFRWKGENVSTVEVESVISRAVGKDAAVYGVEIPGADGRAGMSAIADPGNNLEFSRLEDSISKNLPTYARPIFIRVLNEIDMTGTYKMKKTELQKDGFDINVVKDKCYFYSGGKYVPLDEALYTNIMTGKTRV